MVFGHKDLPDGCQADANGVCEWNSTPAKASSINYATVKLKMSQTVLVAKLLKHEFDAPTLLEKKQYINHHRDHYNSLYCLQGGIRWIIHEENYHGTASKSMV